MVAKKKTNQKVAGTKPASKAGNKSSKPIKKVTAKKVPPTKKHLKQKSIPKPAPKKKAPVKKAVVKKVAKKKAVVASSKKASKSKTKTALKKPQKTAKPTKSIKKPAKAVVDKSKKTATSHKAPKTDQPIQKPLDPVFVKIRLGLLASRTELFKMVESSQELERNVSELTFSNEIDLASSLEGREMVFQLASRDRNGLKLIDDALFKMAHGNYGICEACSKPIGIKRLQILPLTQFCIECQETMERDI